MTSTASAPDALAGRGLSELEVDVLTACLHHRLLTNEQLHLLLSPDTSVRWLQQATRRLVGGGLLGSVGARDAGVRRRQRVFYIEAAGRAIVHDLVRDRTHVMTAERAANALQRHTLIANDVGIAFARHGDRLGHRCGPFDFDHEVGHRYGTGPAARTVVPDLVVRCWLRHPDGDTLLTRFVEIDRGRYSPLVLRNKIRSYARLLTHAPTPPPGSAPAKPAWTREYPVFPKILIVFADQSPTVIDRRISVLAELCRTDPLIYRHLPALWLGCATYHQVVTAGPYEQIWRTPLEPGPHALLDPRPADPQHGHRQPRSQGRGGAGR